MPYFSSLLFIYFFFLIHFYLFIFHRFVYGNENVITITNFLLWHSVLYMKDKTDWHASLLCFSVMIVELIKTKALAEVKVDQNIFSCEIHFFVIFHRGGLLAKKQKLQQKIIERPNEVPFPEQSQNHLSKIQEKCFQFCQSSHSVVLTKKVCNRIV